MSASFPVVWLVLGAILALCVAWWSLRRRRERSYRFADRPARVGLVRGLFGVVFLLVAVVCALLAASIYQYLVLSADRPVAHVRVVEQAPQRFEVTVTPEAGAPTTVVLEGDQWQIDARVIRWRLPVALAGVPSLYRLDRIGGRYIDIDKERTAPRSVHALNESPVPDLWSLRQRFPEWLPFVDADYGSAAFLPMVDGGGYVVAINPRGGLVATPADDATRERLQQLRW